MDTKKINLLYKAECHACKLSSQFSTTLSKNYVYFIRWSRFFLSSDQLKHPISDL